MKVSMSFVLLFVFFGSLYAQDPYTWADCGVPGYRNIHYQSVTISPYPAKTDSNGSLSINIQATIVNAIGEADTELEIWQNNDAFLNIKIAPLCDIISTTNSLSCPIPVGHISFTYTFQDLPDVPTGDYLIKILSRVTLPNGAVNELGCLQLSGEVDGVEEADSCVYDSYAKSELQATFIFDQTDASKRVMGSALQIGPGPLSNTASYGTFNSYESSPDLATSSTLANYAFSAYGTMINTTSQGNVYTQIFNGKFSILYNNANVYETVYIGQFNWTVVTNPANNPSWTASGSLLLDPQYVYFYDTPISSVFTYPLVLGNLNPFSLKSDGTKFSLYGSRSWCVCDVDACGVCGGDDSSCGLHTEKDDKLSSKATAAIVVGVVGGVLGITMVAILARKARRAKRAPLLNEGDLIDHPDKLDYGTMAIDDAIREGERV